MTEKKQSTTRQQTITLPPRHVHEVVFNDTKPNHFHINNLSIATIYLGVQTIPSPSMYELMVHAQGDNIHAMQNGVTRIMLYNDSTQPSRIILTTFEDKFTPTILARSTNGGAATGGGGGSFNGTITGFTASLPSGDNNIGRVKVTEMPNIKVESVPIPAGTNNIGKVEVTKLPMLASNAQGKIGDVGISGGVAITSMPAVSLEVGSDMNVKNKSYDDFFYHQGDVTQTPITLQVNLSRIIYISNDASSPLTVTINNKTITLLGEEVLEELPIHTTTIKIERTEGNGMVRIMGV